MFLVQTVLEQGVHGVQDDKLKGHLGMAETSRKMSFSRVVMSIAVAVIVAIVLLMVIASIALRLDAVGASQFFAYFKDILLIVLVLQCILIVSGVSILVVQVARFVNLLTSEVQPIAQDAKEVASTLKQTTTFISREAVSPIVKAKAFFAGSFAFLRELFQLGRLFKSPTKQDGD